MSVHTELKLVCSHCHQQKFGEGEFYAELKDYDYNEALDELRTKAAEKGWIITGQKGLDVGVNEFCSRACLDGWLKKFSKLKSCSDTIELWGGGSIRIKELIAEELLKKIIDVYTDYNTDNHGTKYCHWCGVRSDFQNRHCKNKDCPIVIARKFLSKGD